ncbi:MAG: SRPBCC family protein [Flavobacteriales bacterium]
MQFTYRVKKSPEFVFNCLTDVGLFVKYHPVISAMHFQSGNAYIVHEMLKLGLVPISFKYLATIESVPEKNLIRMQAKVAKFTHIEMVFELYPDDDGTRITETVSVRTPLPIVGSLHRIFKKQHTKLFENMERSR